ncbi:sensor histidine kinase [Pikeienuella piscinae]|uniref:histidine kinase n=1 Tax=Pikeienuella piscinae TaxID=2748098 RepID=A0A7L5C0L8_9RHOB|nr:sensor histidine kinase [Pikeienuella piscinae]QIE55694.1 sensor histidine kinase [Pikeienuella piscinae]
MSVNPFRFIGLGRLRSRLAVIIAAALAPAGVLAVVQGLNALDVAADRRSDQFEARTLAAVDDVRAALVEVRQTARIAAAAVQAELIESGGCGRTFRSLAEDHDWLSGALVLNRDGEAVCGANVPFDMTDDPDWRAFTADPRYFIVNSRPDDAMTKPFIAALSPLPRWDADAFALMIRIDSHYLNRLTQRDPDARDLLLLDRSGKAFFAAQNGPVDWLPNDRALFMPYSTRSFDELDSTGARRTYFVTALEPGQVWAVSAMEKPKLGAVMLGPEGRALFVPLALWLIAVAVAYFAIDALVTRHVGALRRTAVRIGRGELDAPIGDYEDAPSEVRSFAEAIEAMANNLSERDAKLRETLDVQRRLLLEVHHRVKNNLQTISSLMNLESRRARDPQSLKAIRVIQDRIHSLAMVHQNLYAAENLEEVALDQLVLDISSHLAASLGPSGPKEHIRTSLENVFVPTLIATPVALFISEALGNAFKHGGTTPRVDIELTSEEGSFSIAVRNRVTGRTGDEAEGDGLGVRLMQGFAKQIGGKLEFTETADAYEARLSGPVAPPPALFRVRSGAEGLRPH